MIRYVIPDGGRNRLMPPQVGQRRDGRLFLVGPQVPPAQPENPAWRPPEIIPSDTDWDIKNRIAIANPVRDPGGWGQTSQVVWPNTRVILQNNVTPDLKLAGRDVLKTFSFGFAPSAQADASLLVPAGVQAIAKLVFGVGGGSSTIFLDIGRGCQVTVPATFWSVVGILGNTLPRGATVIPEGTIFNFSCSVAEGSKYSTLPVRRTIFVEVLAGATVIVDIPPYADTVSANPLSGFGSGTVVGVTAAFQGMSGVESLYALTNGGLYPILLDQAQIALTNTTGLNVFMCLSFLLTV